MDKETVQDLTVDVCSYGLNQILPGSGTILKGMYVAHKLEKLNKSIEVPPIRPKVSLKKKIQVMWFDDPKDNYVQY